MPGRFEELRARVEAAVLGAPGVSTPAERRRALEGEGATPELTDFVRCVRDDATRVTDAQVAALQAAGHDEDRLFELLLCAALGAAGKRLDAGLRAMKGGRR